MRSESGYSLVEVLTAGAISVVVGTAIISVLQMSNTQILDGSANFRLVQLQNIASTQIRMETRRAFGVKRDIALDPGGAFVSPAAFPGATGLSEVRLCNPDGSMRAGYRILPNNDSLYEWRAGAWIPFRVGSFALRINPDPDSSNFSILPRRRGIVFNLRYRFVQGGKTYPFPPISETVLCRNTDL